ncbi:hypothetical protein [Winogradskyella sp. 3972H.M.0a.05]|uniref:hypothetical protein n=1 Tax=Winogradskyella sp. 3972H.M.0a.05 TaxID=2950277 RepID=UPI003390C5A8
MRYFNLIATLLICITVTSVFGQKKIETFSYKGKNHNYIIQLPEDFDASKTYPVLIGPSEVKSLEDESFYWRGNSNTQGWILVSYPIYSATGRIGEVKAFLGHLKELYNVEGDKFHAVCFSANSSSIFELVMQIPEYFKGITGMAGNPSNSNKESLKRLKGLKVQFVVGDRDTYWMRAAEQSHSILKGHGVDSKLEIIKNGQHVMEPLIGKGFLDKANRLRN